jgi:sec-independent protein translocase protein TatB
MEVFGIGPLEIVLVVLIAFIVLGPDRIPGTMRQLGKWTRQLRETVNNITRDYNSEIRELTGEITALQDEIRSIQRDLGSIATGFMTTTLPPAGTPPGRPNAAAPSDPAGSESAGTSQSISQPLTDDAKRASTPPAAPPADTDSGNAYEI